MLFINPFALDWMLIDSVIIILLITLLVIVKIFKATTRWRVSLSNKALIESRFNRHELNSPFHRIFLVKSAWFFHNNNLTRNPLSPPVIIMFQMKRRIKIPRIISQGLCSNGFDVVLFRAKMMRKRSHLKEQNLDVNKAITYALDIVFKNSKPNNYNGFFFCIFHSRSGFFSSRSYSSENNFCMLINPFLDKKGNRIIDEQKNQNYIFSQKWRFLQNADLKTLLNSRRQENLFVVEGSRKSFKHYESILLGMITHIVNKRN